VGSIPSISRIRGIVSAVLLFTTLTATAADWQSRITPRVQNILNAANAAQSVESIAAARQPSSSVRYDSTGRLQIDVEFDCAQPAPTAALTAVGMIIGTTVKAPPLCVVEGWAPVASIPALASVPHVTKIDLPHYAIPHPPGPPPSVATTTGTANAWATNGSSSIDANGITIMNVGNYIQQTGVNGTGITIGVISDDATNLALIQARGELPAVNVVAPSATPMPHPKLTDEGTVMLEEVYAAAPGASLAFCGPGSYAEYVECVKNLISVGATVVSDDTGYSLFDVMSAPPQNLNGLAVGNILTNNPNVMLFHSVGNQAPTYWQGTYSPAPQTASLCHGQTDNYIQQFGSADYTIWQTTGGNDIYLASALPAGQTSPNNFDVYIYDPVNSVIVTCSSAASNGGTIGGTSYTVINGSAITSGTYWIFIATADNSLSGTFLKLIGTDDASNTSFSPMTSGAPASPQDFAVGVITVGAVYGNDGIGTIPEPFSNTGPIQFEFPSPSSLKAPLLAAPDAIYVDNSGTKFVASGGIFYGTSAASPNAAAVATLLRSAFPTLTPSQVTGYLEAGATQLGTAPWNGTFGYGRVDALGALAQIPAPTISGLQGTTIVGGSSSQPLPFSIGGIGTLKVTVTAPIFNAVVAPSNCGSAPGTCTLTLTPALGALGTATVQVTVTDGANRSRSMQVPITLTAPPPPTVTITSEAMQSVQVNSPIAPIGFSIAGTGPLTVGAAESGLTGFSVTSGCASSTTTCTVSLSNAGTTTGTAFLTLTVRDLYGQVTSATATVTILPPTPPTIAITAGASQNVTVNGAIAPITFTLTGTAPLTVTPNTSDISTITITSGCGTTTMTCTATLGSAQSTPGTATVKLTVEDNYVQSASATATVTESAAPSKSGGGALDPLALLGLTGLVLMQLNRAQRKRQ
jgi:hypothetical protein